MEINSRVPQGTVHRPMLNLLYTKDILKLSETSTDTFGNDTVLTVLLILSRNNTVMPVMKYSIKVDQNKKKWSSLPGNDIGCKASVKNAL